jgi:hypothetical protein
MVTTRASASGRIRAMRTLLWLTPILTLAALAACGDDDDDDAASPSASQTVAATRSGGPTPTPGEPTSQTVDCTPNAEIATEDDLTWDDLAPDDLPAPEGYEVQDAEGDAPLLEVLKDGETVGSAELLQFRLPDNLDPDLGFNGLENWANEFYDSVGTERELAGLTLEPETPLPSSFGEYCGASYGYTVTNEDGEVVERYIGVATYDPERIYLTTAIFDELNPETSWASVEDLEAYAPSLRELAGALSFPPD